LTEPRLALLDDLFSDDFAIWYNFSGQSLDRATALAFFQSYFPTISLRYDDIVCTPTSTGWVQQHLVQTDGSNGFKIRDMPVCMVVTIRDKQISRIEEYIDSGQTAGFDASQMEQAS
jgi:hypothetical protein